MLATSCLSWWPNPAAESTPQYKDTGELNKTAEASSTKFHPKFKTKLSKKEKYSKIAK
jgi:hypothetical protein